MDIHPPDKPIHSWRDFALHLVTITIGILIALGLDAFIEAVHWRHVVHEAEANIDSELRDNKEQVGLAKALVGIQSEHRKILSFLNDEIAHGKSDIHGFNLSHPITGLTATSWETSEAIGALAHMPYVEVKRYDGAYNLQRHFEDVQQRGLNNVLSSMAFVAAQDPTKMGKQELRRARDQIMTSLSSLEAERQIASQLSQAYNQALYPKQENGPTQEKSK
ncbi:MAG TPA: hypothetical protein VH325_01555 [Bryobacteraceae bacterium]|jgi:hypothetical protein|nr:hypothetical protein [Bryobacteraceae bacterium]